MALVTCFAIASIVVDVLTAAGEETTDYGFELVFAAPFLMFLQVVGLVLAVRYTARVRRRDVPAFPLGGLILCCVALLMVALEFWIYQRETWWILIPALAGSALLIVASVVLIRRAVVERRRG